MKKKPNIVYVFSDQHRWEATGYAGNPDVKTPYMDRLHEQSVSFDLALANAPVCGPARACLLTGQRSLTHGIFVNDVNLDPKSFTFGKILKDAGYDTGYIGKWHLDGYGRLDFIPEKRRHGFDFWRVMECTHNYNQSYYYGDTPVKLKWQGFDAEAQTACAIEYIQNHDKEKPFALFLSWGPPHSPYHTAPDQFKVMYQPDQLKLRGNIPVGWDGKAREMLVGYYAHISALDHYLGQLWRALEETGIEEDTIFIYTSDHGDMLGSHGHLNKQRPWDESIRVPFIMHYPNLFGRKEQHVAAPFSTIDIMPTILELCDIKVPEHVEGVSFASCLRSSASPIQDAALIECIHPFGQWARQDNGKEYRGIRTERYTYVKDLQDPWLLYDNAEDPLQLNNLIGTAEGESLLSELDGKLQKILDHYNDEFLHGDVYIQRWGYTVDETGTVPYSGYDPNGE